MKRWVLFAAWVGLTAMSVACVGAPQLEVSELVYDFGVVIEGTEVEHDFLLTNRGDEDLVILSVTATCGCTTTSLSTSTLPPLREVRLSVQLSTVGYGGASVEKHVTIKTNDPQAPQAVLALRGTVVKPAAYLMEARDVSGKLALIVDVRSAEQYARGHLVGAVNLRYEDRETWMGLLPMNVPVILYDADGTQAEALAAMMLPLGYLDLRILTGGFAEWTRQYGDRLVVTLPFLLVL